MITSHADAKELCVRATHIMADGTLADFEAVVHPDARNREDIDEPPASRGRGPAAFYATALWLRDAYAELRWEIHDVIAEGELVVLHATMSGQHVRTFVGYVGWTPPSPRYLVRMLLATRRARREAQRDRPR